VAPLHQRAAEICSLLERAGAGPFEVGTAPDGVAGASGPGFSLSGGGATERHAAETLVRRLLRAEQDNESLCSEILVRYEEATLVHRLSQALSMIAGEKAIARIALEDAVHTLGARTGEMWLVGDAAVALASVVPGEDFEAAELCEQGPLAALREGRPWIREASPAGEAVIAVPIPGPQAPLGVVVLRGHASGRAFRTSEVKLLATLCCLVSSFIGIERLAQSRRLTASRETRGDLVREVQRCLLPAHGPRVEGLDVAASSLAGNPLGADHYAWLTLANGDLSVVVAGDAGKGIAAALRMAAVQGVFRAEATRASSAQDLLRRVRSGLASALEEQQRAGAFVARLGLAERVLEYANAGHGPPLLLRRDGRSERLDASGPPLGIPGPDEPAGARVDFGPGDVLLIFSDGLAAARGPAEPFGTKRLIEIVRSCGAASAAEIRERVLTALREHTLGAVPEDDVTLVVVRRTPRAGEEEERP